MKIEIKKADTGKPDHIGTIGNKEGMNNVILVITETTETTENIETTETTEIIEAMSVTSAILKK